MDVNAATPAPQHERPADKFPFIDEHTRLIPASIVDVWRALTVHLAASNNPPTKAYASLVGARPRRGTGEFPRRGATLPGFAVSEVEPPRRLVLTGEHYFSRYTLIFCLESRDGGTLVSARSRAEFPGLHGKAYRTAVIRSGAHRALVRRLLRLVQRRVEANGATSTQGAHSPAPQRRLPRGRSGLGL